MESLRESLKSLNGPLVLSQLLLGLLVTVFIWRAYLSPIADVPGPIWASVTRLWHMKEIYDGKQNLKILKLHDKHGHFVRIGPDEVSVTHPEAIKKLILTPQYKGHWYAMMKFPDWRFRTPMAVLEPKAKVELSKQLSSAYTMSNVIKSEEHITSVVERLLQKMDSYAAKHDPMDLARQVFFTYTAFDIVGEVVFSSPFGFVEKGIDIDDSIAQTLGFECYISIAAFAQWLRDFSMVANPIITCLGILPTNYLAVTSNKALDARKQNQDARFDFVAHWLKTHEQNPDKLSYRDVQSAVMANVGAGSDTVSCALQSFVYHMIRCPEAWDRLRQEIDDAGLMDGVVSYTDASQLPYLQACIKETLRIFHPVPMGTPRIVPKGGVEIGGHYFPAGVTLSLNTFSMNLSEAVWGPDAKQFKPERWMEGDVAAMEKRYLPFSGGIGTCVGQHLARIELSKILATIVRDYDIRQVDPKQEWTYYAYFTVVPRDWPVYIEKRK
ncbi:hypothetical protein PG989_001086 [Apiospora arundinis]